jgi:beta-lactamase class A
MLVRIRSGAAVSPAASEEMYRVLSKSFWDGESLSGIPPDVAAASKQGAVNRSRSEVVLVGAPSGAYVFSVITKNQEDTSWEADNEGFVLLRSVSRLLWEHFEPGAPWRPAENVERYW